jgi:hypothetical protein
MVKPVSMTPIVLGFRSMAGIGTYVVLGKCAWLDLVDGVVVVVGLPAGVVETRRGTFQRMIRLL